MKIISTGPFLFSSVAQSDKHVLISFGADMWPFTVSRASSSRRYTSSLSRMPLRTSSLLSNISSGVDSVWNQEDAQSHSLVRQTFLSVTHKTRTFWFDSTLKAQPKKCYFILRTSVFSFWNTPLGQLPQNFPTWWQLMAKKLNLESLFWFCRQVLY